MYFTTDDSIAKLSKRKSTKEPSAVLFVGNLSYTTTKSSLMKAFDGCVDGIIAVDVHTGKTLK